MDDAVSIARLQAAAERVDTAHAELVRLVRVADHNGIPKTRIADAIGMNRETVSRWCKEQES